MPAMMSQRSQGFQLNDTSQPIEFVRYFIVGSSRNGSRRKNGIFEARTDFHCYIGVGSGEAPLDKSKSVSFEVRRTALQEHRFQIGENVYFTSRPIGHMVANSIYQVVKLLPSDGSDYQYRIKNPNEAFERVARESQLENSR